MIANKELIKSSFRDPSAYCYTIGDDIYRKINDKGLDDYNHLMSSGLYEKLHSLGLLISHTEMPVNLSTKDCSAIILMPKKIPFISYPYEWCFSQHKDAALLTLKVASIAVEYGMALKDASAYNIQFLYGKPILIDTCSFTKYQDGEPWLAYKQFCQHFLVPLALMSKKDIRLGGLAKNYIDGIPIDLASLLLKWICKFSTGLFVHVYLHAKFKSKFSETPVLAKYKRKISKNAYLGLLDNLVSTINKLTWSPMKTEWSDYYNNTNYTDKASEHKALLLCQLVGKIPKKCVTWDLGGNNGFYSRAIKRQVTSIVCWDIDPVAVESNYRKTKDENCTSILPLMQDLTNPSTSIGWAQTERDGFKERGAVDLILALALVHHLAISNNVPLSNIAEYLSCLSEYLIIEFVPKEDSKVKLLLANRQDIFDQYELSSFKKIFSVYYSIEAEALITDTCRTMFLMKRIHKC